MKNLRRVFAVVLAVALVFSLMAVASAKQVTDYSDTSKVKYTEAVDLVSGLGIMTGSGDTAFDPTGTFTREQAAKVICYMLVGSTVGSTLTATTSNFSDVAVTRWSAPYIQYCYTAGIINGSGDGKFNPEASVTGTQFAKMVLTALGYGAKGEYTGSNWELNTLVKAQSLGILDTAVNYSAAATREEVAKYAFNALTKCYTMTYNSVTGSYNKTLDTAIDGNGFYPKSTLGYSSFKLEKTSVSNTYYGALSHYWKAYTTTVPVKVSGSYSDDTVLFSTSIGYPFNLTNVTTPNSGYYKVGLETASGGVTYYVNGVLQTAAQVATLGTVDASAGNFGITGQCGVITKYIDNTTAGGVAGNTTPNGLADVVYITKLTTSTMNAAPTVDPAGNVNISAAGLSTNYPKDTLIYPAGMAAKDYFTYVKWNSGSDQNTYIQKATKVTGQITSANSMKSQVNFAGTTYFVAAGMDTKAIANSANYNKDAEAWISSDGYMIYCAPNTTATYNVGLVVGYSYAGGIGGKASVRLYTNDGKVAVYDVAPATSTTTSNTATWPQTNAGDVPNQTTYFAANATMVTYTFNANNQVKVVPIEMNGVVGTPSGSDSYAAKSSYVPIHAGSDATTNYYINASTKVFYFDQAAGTFSSGVKASVLSGFASTKEVANGVSTFYVVDPDNAKLLDAIYFNAPGPQGTSGNYAYITMASYNVRNVNGVNYYDYNVLVNGATTTKTLTATEALGAWDYPAVGLFSYDVDANGYVVNPSQSGSVHHGSWLVNYVDSSFVGFATGSGNDSFTVNADTKFFQVDSRTLTVTSSTAMPNSNDAANTYVTDYVKNTNVSGEPALYVYYTVVNK